MSARPLLPLAALWLLTGAAPPNARAQLDALVAADARVGAVAYKLARDGVALCPRRAFITGASLHHLGQYGASLRVEARRRWPVDDAVAVAAVAPGSAAALAGLRAGDAIVRVDGAALPATGTPTARVTAAARALHRTTGEPILLDLRRRGASLTLRLAPEPACRSRIQLLPAHRARASADGELVTVTTPLLTFTRDDDELAFVLAHEIAHNALGHEARGGGSNRRARELAADRLALRIMAAAGFRAGAALPFVDRLYRRGPAGGFLNALGHLGRRERVAALRAALQE